MLTSGRLKSTRTIIRMSGAKMAYVTVGIESMLTPEQKAGLKQLPRMLLNLRWIFADEEKLRSKSLNRLIAVKNRKVVFADDNAVEDVDI